MTTIDLIENQIADADDALNFIMGGHAVFNLTSRKTGKRYTYKVDRKTEEGARTRFVDGAPAFVKVMTDGADGYTYAGFIPALDPAKVVAGKKGPPAFANARAALSWALQHLIAGNMPEALVIQHSGCCARCGRELTDPASIASGFGPECVKHVGG